MTKFATGLTPICRQGPGLAFHGAATPTQVYKVLSSAVARPFFHENLQPPWDNYTQSRTKSVFLRKSTARAVVCGKTDTVAQKSDKIPDSTRQKAGAIRVFTPSKSAPPPQPLAVKWCIFAQLIGAPAQTA